MLSQEYTYEISNHYTDDDFHSVGVCFNIYQKENGICFAATCGYVFFHYHFDGSTEGKVANIPAMMQAARRQAFARLAEKQAEYIAKQAQALKEQWEQETALAAWEKTYDI